MTTNVDGGITDVYFVYAPTTAGEIHRITDASHSSFTFELCYIRLEIQKHGQVNSNASRNSECKARVSLATKAAVSSFTLALQCETKTFQRASGQWQLTGRGRAGDQSQEKRRPSAVCDDTLSFSLLVYEQKSE